MKLYSMYYRRGNGEAEFGVMPLAPEAGQRFEKYEPGKYRCIPVEDDEIERLLPETLGLPMYWHTVDRRAGDYAILVSH